MQFVRYQSQARTSIAVATAGGLFELADAEIAGDMHALIASFPTIGGRLHQLVSGKPTHSISDVKLLAPIMPRRNIFCIGKNYAEHAAEFGGSGFDSGSVGGADIPEYPIIFSKPPSSVIGPGEAIDSRLDPYASVDYEGELAVIIGKEGRVAETDDPMSFVFGYTIMNDVTSRELQKRHKQWLLGKGVDTFAPMGPAIVSADELDGLDDREIRTSVNGELRQQARFADLIFGIPELVRVIGRSITLQIGDVIATGTPQGVGIGFKPPRYLRSGDQVRIEVDGIGLLENPVI